VAGGRLSGGISEAAGRALLAALGAREVRTNGRWLQGPCPLAPWTHPTGRDTNPSFGVNLDKATFHCFTCRSGPVYELVQVLEMILGWMAPAARPARYRLGDARLALEGVAVDRVVLPPYEEQEAQAKPFQEWPAWYLDAVSVPWRQSDRAAWYLAEGRALPDPWPASQPVPPEVADAFGLRYDAEWDRVVCPYSTASGLLAGARGRAAQAGRQPAHFDYTWNGVNNAPLVWFNERALELAAADRKPVLVVEGQFDCMNVWPTYPYVVAVLTRLASRPRLDKLLATDGVVLMLDNDPPGVEARAYYARHLGGKLLGRVGYEGKDPAKLTRAQADAALSSPLLAA